MNHHARLIAQLGAAVVVLLGNFALLVWRLNQESIWHDEGWSIRAIHSPFGTPDDNTPFIYYTLLHLFQRLGFGETPFALRYGSVLIALAGTALALHIGLRWFGLRGGLTAGVLIAGSPLLWEYAQEVRAYVAVPVFALLFLFVADRLLVYTGDKKIPPRLWAGVLLLQTIGLYTHNLVVPLVIWLNVAVGTTWLLRRDWRRLRMWGMIQVAGAVLYLPWLNTQSPSGTPLNTPPKPSLELAQNIWRGYFLPVLAQLENTTDTFAIDAAGIVLLWLAVIALIAGKSHRNWLFFSQAMLVPLLSTALLIVANIDFHPRYYVASVPAALLLAIAGVETLKMWLPLHGVWVSNGIIAVFALLIARASLSDIAATRAYQHDDFAGLARYYATLPEDAIILVPFDREPVLQNYYRDQFDIRARMVTLDLHSDADRVMLTLNHLLEEKAPRHIEFLTWFQLPADVRAMYPCLLTAASAQVEQPRLFYGLSTQAFVLEKPPVFASLKAAPIYRDLRLKAARYLVSPDGVCIETQWQLTQARSDDLAIGMQLLNPLGWEIVRADAPIAKRTQVTTSDWITAHTGEAYHLLSLPPAAPLTDYTVQWVIYSDETPSGLDNFALSGESLGKEYRLNVGISTQGPALLNEPAAPTLVEDNTGEDYTLESSQPLQVTVLLAGLPTGNLTIRLQGKGWQLEQEATYPDSPVLSWHEFRFSPEQSGEADLLVGDTLIAHYTIQETDRRFFSPEVDFEVAGYFPTVGFLTGVTVEDTTVKSGIPFTVSLVWQAESSTEIAYTVFVQLVDSNWRVLAQSDRMPVDGARPTTGWQSGEYLEDAHTLNWNVGEFRGNASLIVGFYNPNTFERVKSSEDSDFIQLPVTITVEEN